MILGAHCTGSEEDKAARMELLAPIERQNDQIYDYLRRRRAVADVDPATGEETVVVVSEVPDQPIEAGTETDATDAPTETPTA